MLRIIVTLSLVAGLGCGRVGFEPLGVTSGDGGGVDARGDARGDAAPRLDGAVDGRTDDATVGADGRVPPADSSVVGADGSTVSDGGSGTANFMFVTSTEQSPAGFGGLAAADAVCRDRATVAGLPGTFVAYLSTTTVAARDRLAGARGWVRPDGTAFADTIDSLYTGEIFYPPMLDEEGRRVPDGFVATGTNRSGALGDANCADWTVASGTRVGWPHSGRETWGSALVLGCTASRIYCFGIDRVAIVGPPTPTGRLSFLAAASVPGGGLGVADAHCASAASSAGLSGTFRALLATEGASAASRFAIGPWFRVDGVRFTADLVTLDAPLRVTASGASVNERAWVGAADAMTPGTRSTTCQNWTATGGNGAAGQPDTVTTLHFDSGTEACGSALALYCLEE